VGRGGAITEYINTNRKENNIYKYENNIKGIEKKKKKEKRDLR
jgi:hypothetical protein